MHYEQINCCESNKWMVHYNDFFLNELTKVLQQKEKKMYNVQLQPN